MGYLDGIFETLGVLNARTGVTLADEHTNSVGS
jgi:hypothetical protein